LWHAYPDWSNLFDYLPDWEEQLRPLRDFIAERGGGPRNVGDRNHVLRFGRLIPDYLLRRYALAGRAEDIRRQINEIAESGITEIAIFPTPLPGQTTESVFRDFLSAVLPHLSP
jgi:alkanesulfonate monooxygenase SsuD/methylene tetrahydromethanopterin reductase-like flavin-dependent oxidoreductase (luciferase family)